MWFVVVPRHIFVDPNIQFFLNSPDSKIVGSPDICLGTNPNHIFGEMFLPNLRYRYKHKKISPNMWFGLVPRHISGDPTILLSGEC